MKKELIEKIMKDLPAGATTWEIEESLKKNLPDFSRIDEERIFDLYRTLSFKDTIQEYNSTLPPALKPLPKDMPKEYNSLATPYQVWLQVQQEYGTPANNLQPLPKEKPKWFHNGISYHDLWSMVCLNYGTPAPKPDLPTVEELAKEMLNVWNVNTFNEVAEYVIDKYSLHPREWWQDLKEGDKFMYAGEAYEYYGYEVNIRGEVTLWGKSTWKFRLSGCTPYTPPSAQEIIAKHNLSEEEVRAIREGK
jgi:hypothetical protein